MSLARKIRCTVSAIAAHGGGVYTVDLAPSGILPPFRPGQFAHLTVDDYDPSSFWPESRVFSIASSPHEKKRLRICYLKPEMPKNVWLVYGARNPGLLLFREMIEGQLAKVPNFHLVYFTEDQTAELAAQVVGLAKPPACVSGRISLDALFQQVPDAAKKVFYLSGPPIMLNTLSSGLRQRGLPPDQIRMDAWE